MIKTRASQINGCAYGLHVDTRDARAKGESEERRYVLDVLDVWRESPRYTDRERTALAWAETVTLVSKTHVPDAVYEEARQQFSETELINLTVAVATINAWNRVAITFRAVPQSPTAWHRQKIKVGRFAQDRSFGTAPDGK